jgi:hypothetical protein
MSTQAQVISVEALEAFRSDLILFITEMSPALDEVSSEVLRMRLWLQNDQRTFWELELRKRRRKLEEMQGELFNARISLMNDSTIIPQMQVQKAQRAVVEAEQKMAALKKWERELDKIAAPLVKQVDALHGFVSTELGHGVASLSETIRALEAYRQVTPQAGGTA